MAVVSWPSAARQDLVAIRDYYEQSSPGYARTVISKILGTVSNLEAFPRKGREVPEIEDEAFREVIVEGYRVVYRGSSGAQGEGTAQRIAEKIEQPCVRCNEWLCANLNHLSRLPIVQGLVCICNQRQQVFETIAAGTQHHDQQIKRRRVLLIAEVGVHRDESIKLRLRLGQELTVGNTLPGHVCDRSHIMRPEGPPQLSTRQAFVEKNAHSLLLGRSQKRLLGLLQEALRLLPRHGRKVG